MRADFRREHQIAWAQAEAGRLQGAYGAAVDVMLHIVDNVFTRGERVMTISDPGGVGAAAAVCLTGRSDEGSLWTAELIPVPQGDDGDIPPSRPIQEVALAMRYNTCVHATHGAHVGRPSGDGGRPDFAEGVERLIRGEVKVQRRRSFVGDRPPAYAQSLG